jgi:hypothetical protein
MKQTTQQSAELTSVNPPEERAPVSTETKIPNASLNTESERSESVGGNIRRCTIASLVRIWTDNPMLSLITVAGLPADSTERANGLYVGNSALVQLRSDQMNALKDNLRVDLSTSITYDPDIDTNTYTNCTVFTYGSTSVQLVPVPL